MIFNIDEYLNIIGELPLNMRFALGRQTYTNAQKNVVTNICWSSNIFLQILNSVIIIKQTLQDYM